MRLALTSLMSSLDSVAIAAPSPRRMQGRLHQPRKEKRRKRNRRLRRCRSLRETVRREVSCGPRREVGHPPALAGPFDLRDDEILCHTLGTWGPGIFSRDDERRIARLPKPLPLQPSSTWPTPSHLQFSNVPIRPSEGFDLRSARQTPLHRRVCRCFWPSLCVASIHCIINVLGRFWVHF